MICSSCEYSNFFLAHQMLCKICLNNPLNCEYILVNILSFSILSLVSAVGFMTLGSLIISYSLEASKEIGRVIYQAYGGQILDGINQALPGKNSEKYKRELVYKVIGDVIHKVLVDDIGNTLYTTVWGCGIAVLILALIQVRY